MRWPFQIPHYFSFSMGCEVGEQYRSVTLTSQWPPPPREANAIGPGPAEPNQNQNQLQIEGAEDGQNPPIENGVGNDDAQNPVPDPLPDPDREPNEAVRNEGLEVQNEAVSALPILDRRRPRIRMNERVHRPLLVLASRDALHESAESSEVLVGACSSNSLGSSSSTSVCSSRSDSLPNLRFANPTLPVVTSNQNSPGPSRKRSASTLEVLYEQPVVFTSKRSRTENNVPEPEPKPDPVFTISDPKMYTRPTPEQINREIVEANNWIIPNLIVGHVDYGYATFSGFRDLSLIGKKIDISQYIKFSHGDIEMLNEDSWRTFRVGHVSCDFINISREDFASVVWQKQINDSQLESIVKMLHTLMNGDGQYNEDQQRWIVTFPCLPNGPDEKGRGAGNPGGPGNAPANDNNIE